jgi:hypothetical protein
MLLGRDCLDVCTMVEKQERDTTLFREVRMAVGLFWPFFCLLYQKGGCHEALHINNGCFDALGYPADRDRQDRS